MTTKDIVPTNGTKNAVTTNGSTAVTKPGGALVVITAPLHHGLREAILDLIAAFPAGAGGVSDADRTRSLKIYKNALEGLPEAVCEAALNHLQLHNHRNPFAPTAQDVREEAIKLSRAWKERVVHYYWNRGEGWGDDRVDIDAIVLSTANKGYKWGPEPGEEGCLIPAEMITQWMHGSLRHLLWEDGDFPGGCNYASRIDIETMEFIPDELWPEPDMKAKAIWARKDRLAHEAQREREQADVSKLSKEARNVYFSLREISGTYGYENQNHTHEEAMKMALEVESANRKLREAAHAESLRIRDEVNKLSSVESEIYYKLTRVNLKERLGKTSAEILAEAKNASPEMRGQRW